MAGVADFKIGAADISFDGTDLGLTNEDGIIVHYEPVLYEHKSAKYGDTPLRVSAIGFNLTVEATLAEINTDNIEAAFAGIVDDNGVLAVGGVAGLEVASGELVITPTDGSEIITIKKAVPFSAVDLTYKASEPRLIKVTFKALADTSESDADNVAVIEPAPTS